ncbi:S1C family serine protease [Cardinium endosymbiont of Culicoides punctatus]|uniref:S1C family serine protease n=1 Tax=Cardinium endosymbiont of Culicoides punctatus TaxID=2304601 RepID=UPI0010588F8F|nr:S1C family serine protease [Cardinium endosymbiont of Culicoides punctatus]TDG95758.1 Serine protease Do-like HtrB [Cardinium endosymbiont of Culicoides punctatus]
MKRNYNRYVIWICFHMLLSVCAQTAFAKPSITPTVLEHAKKSVVTIQVTTSLSAYQQESKWYGTGFVIDREAGYILTNQHVIGAAVIGTYEVTFYNGIRMQANLVYYDPWLDYGFLKVDPKMIPNDVKASSFSLIDPCPDQPIFIIGNNEGNSLSLHTGTVASIYHVIGAMPQHAIRLSLNTRGGSSGSPVFNSKGQAIALNYAGSNTFAYALHPAYIRYALPFIKKGHTPIRKHIGAFVDTYSLTDAMRYNDFPVSKQQAYLKQFPNSSSTVIQVTNTLANTPAASQLLPGDILWAINGKEIGPSLVDFDLALNRVNKGDTIQLLIFRKGQWKELTLQVYDLEEHKIKKMVRFGGTVFFESDDFFSHQGGEVPKTLTFAFTEPYTIFHQVKHWAGYGQRCFRLKVLSFDGIPVKSLNDLVQRIPLLMAKKYFTMEYINTAPICTYGSFFSDYQTGHNHYISNVAYDSGLAEPTLYIFDNQEMQWVKKTIKSVVRVGAGS